MTWLYDPANRAEAIDILVKEIGSSPADSAKTYDYYVRDLKAFRPDMMITAAGLQAVQNALIETGDLTQAGPADKFIDTSYVRAVH
jgi:hypothetical protein